MKQLLSLLLTLCLLLPGCALADSADLDMLLNKGANFVQEKDYDSAAICYDIASKLAPDDPAVPAALAAMYVSQENYQSALGYIKEALEMSPASGALYLTKADILYRMRRLEEADLAVKYAGICGEKPSTPMLVTAAAAYAQSGQYEKAIDRFDALPMNTWWESHSEAYGNALIRTGRLDLARELGLLENTYKDDLLAHAMKNGMGFTLSMVSEDIMAYPVYCSTANYEQSITSESENAIGEPTPDGLRIKLSNTLAEAGASADNIRLLAASPSGNARLYNIDGIVGLVRNHEITCLMLNEDRGARSEEGYEATTYKFYDRLCSRPVNTLELDGVTWSPDERYIALTFPMQSLQNFKNLDLLLIDTHTGEVFVAEATPTKISQDGRQMALFARFDHTSENVYYMVYGSYEDSHTALKRYNLATGEAELLCMTGDEPVEYPQLGMDLQGRIKAISCHISAKETAGVVEFTEVNGKWKTEVTRFSNPSSIQEARRHEYAANNDLSLILNRSRMLDTAIRFDNDHNSIPVSVYNLHYLTIRSSSPVIQHQDMAIMLPWEGSKAEAITINENFIQAYAKPLNEGYWQPVVGAGLSPDGFYALVLTQKNKVYDDRTLSLHLLDLQTLDFVTIDLPEEVQNKRPTITGAFQITWLENHQFLLQNYEQVCLFNLEIQ